MGAVVKLGEVTEFINGGAWNQSAYSETGIPVVRVSDIHNFTVDLGNCKYLPESALEKYAKNLLREGDLVICTVGSHPTQPNSVVGRPGIMPKQCHGALLNQNAVCIRPSTDKLDRVWLGYLARSQAMKDYIIAHARGSASQVRVAIGGLKDYSFDLPSVEDQIEVAHTLQNYDRLIENNNRRIAILEDMAQSLYLEWFVKFRFPSHEDVKFKDSPLGQIPEGWEEMTIGDVAKVKGGKRLPKGKKVLDDETPYPYLRVKDFGEDSIDRSDIKFIDEESHLATQRYIITTKDIYVSIAGTIGRVGVIPYILNNAHLTENAAKITDITQPLLQYYIHRYLHADTGRKLLISRASGSSQPKLALYKIAELPLLLPTEDILREFHEHQESILALSHSLENKNENIKKQRDMLLPRLISGKINLKD